MKKIIMVSVFISMTVLSVHGSAELPESLSKKCKFDLHRTDEDQNAMMSIDRLHRICSSKVINTSATYEQGRTILHIAALYLNDKNIIRKILKNNADINFLDNNYQNAAHLAMKSGNYAVANLLAERGINLAQLDCNDNRPVDYHYNLVGNAMNARLYKQIRQLTIKQERQSLA
jgi:ankyrin repeat protein